MTAYGHSYLYCSSPAFLIARKKKELLKDLRKVQSTRSEHEYDVNAPNDHVPLQWGNLSQACWVLKFFSFFYKITISYEHLLRSPSETWGGTTNMILLVPCSKYLVRNWTGPKNLSTIDINIQNLTVTVPPKHRPPTIFAAASSLGLVLCMGKYILGIRWKYQTANDRESSKHITSTYSIYSITSTINRHRSRHTHGSHCAELKLSPDVPGTSCQGARHVPPPISIVKLGPRY